MTFFDKKPKRANGTEAGQNSTVPLPENGGEGRLPPSINEKIEGFTPPSEGLLAPKAAPLADCYFKKKLNTPGMSTEKQPVNQGGQGVGQTNLNQISGLTTTSNTPPTWSTRPADQVTLAMMKAVERAAREAGWGVDTCDRAFRRLESELLDMIGSPTGSVDDAGKPDAARKRWEAYHFEAHLALLDFLAAVREHCAVRIRVEIDGTQDWERTPDTDPLFVHIDERARLRHVLLDSTFRGQADELARLFAKQAEAEAAMAAGNWNDQKAAMYRVLTDRIAELAEVIERYRPDLMPEPPAAAPSTYTGPEGPEAHFIAAGGLYAIAQRFDQAIADALWDAMQAWRAYPDDRARHAAEYKRLWTAARAAEDAAGGQAA